MPEHFPGIADSFEGTDREISSIRDQAEAGKEAQHKRARKPYGDCGCPNQSWRQDTEHWASPGHCERVRILRQVCARDRQGVQDHPDHLPARQPCSEDMTELMDGLHPQPRAEECGDNENTLIYRLHGDESLVTCRGESYE
jgi:hypothetical protein